MDINIFGEFRMPKKEKIEICILSSLLHFFPVSFHLTRVKIIYKIN